MIFKLDVLSLLGIDIDSTSSDNDFTNSKLAAHELDGIYTRKFDLTILSPVLVAI